MPVLHTFAVCAYQESPYLEACLQSLLTQTVKGRILMVTSTPNVYIKKCADQYDIPLIVNDKEGGITQDWNFAYTHADSRYVTIAHQDDIYEPDYLEHVISRMEKSPRPLIFFSDYYEIRDGERIYYNRLLQIKRLMLLPMRLPGAERSRWIRRRILSFGSPICCPSVTFAKENLPYVVFRNGYRACEDWEAWESLSKRQGEFLYCRKALMGHRIHEESETTASIGNNKRTQEEFEMFCKFWPTPVARVLSGQYARAQDFNQAGVRDGSIGRNR